MQVVCRGVRELVVKDGHDKMSSVKLLLSLELEPLYCVQWQQARAG